MSEPTNEELLAATTPEAMESLMAKYGAGGDAEQGEDEDAGDVQADAAPQPGAESSATPGASVKQAEPVAQQAALPEDDGEPAQGVATKSGRHVLPYSVLADARHSARTWKTQAQALEDQLAQAKRELEALKTGASASEIDAALAELSDADVEEVAQDIPALGKALKAIKTVGAAVKAAPARVAAPVQPAMTEEELADEARASALEAMKGRPLLTRWAQDPDSLIWKSAVELDDKLKADPRWASNVDRFAEVERLMADRLGIEVPNGQAKAPAATPKAAPAKAPAKVEEFTPNTLSDLGAGATGESVISEKSDGMALASKFLKMSDEQVAAYIARMG